LKWWEYQTNVKIYSSTTVVEHTEENGRGDKPMSTIKQKTHRKVKMTVERGE
jgi:hypothetical protein